MSYSVRHSWLPFALFVGSVALAAVLALLVFLTPWVDPSLRADAAVPRVIGLFAHDPVLRRTALASAVGLVVTAFIFYWPQVSFRPRPPRDAPPPTPVVGA